MERKMNKATNILIQKAGYLTIIGYININKLQSHLSFMLQIVSNRRTGCRSVLITLLLYLRCLQNNFGLMAVFSAPSPASMLRLLATQSSQAHENE